MKMPVEKRQLFVRCEGNGTPPRWSAVMQRLPLESIAGMYAFGISRPVPHTVAPCANTAATTATAVNVNFL